MTRIHRLGLLAVVLVIVLAMIPLVLPAKYDQKVTLAIQVLFMGLLTVVTAYYADRTAEISEGTKKQADASLEMAKEMHEQSLAALKPMLWFAYSRSTLEVDLIRGPTVFDSLDLINVRGPAINIHWMLFGTTESKAIERSVSTFRVLLPAEKSEQEVNTLFKRPSDGRVTLECVYQDVKSNWYSTIVPIEVQYEHQEGRPDHSSIRGLDHIIWKPLLSGEGEKLHERYHADTKE